MSTSQIVLWVYIALMMIGGVIGFARAGSKASIIASTAFSIILALFALNILPLYYNWVVLLFLLVFFAMQFGRKKKFMPNGFMTILTLLALLAPLIISRLS
jgi:uncharacterized membrane protein (UPF0136 family)